MLKEEALSLLMDYMYNPDYPSKVNPALTIKAARLIVFRAVEELPEGAELSDLWVKRVKQVVQNRRRPHE